MSERCDCDELLTTEEFEHYDNCRVELMKRPTADHYRRHYPKNPDGSFNLQNKNIIRMKNDVLYHLALSTDDDLPAMFGDVKFVCMGGTDERMATFANHMSELLQQPVSHNLTAASKRYAMYKVGPVLSVSHGIGIPSATTLLQELIKLLFHAGARDPVLVRAGTSGGVGLRAGTVVVADCALSGLLAKTYDLPVLGRMTSRPALFDRRLAAEISSVAEIGDGFETVRGGTMAADDFYLGQGRTDGPVCGHSEEEKRAFLRRAAAAGVRNIEMEATGVAALAWQAGLRAAVVCVTLVDRLQGDQVTISKATSAEYQRRPLLLLGRYIARVLRRRPPPPPAAPRPHPHTTATCQRSVITNEIYEKSAKKTIHKY